MREVLFVLLLLLVSIPGVRADATQRSRSSTPPLVVGGESLVVSSEDEMEPTGTGAGRPDGAGGPGATTVKVSDRDIISIEIGTWNIQSGRNGRLETALRALDKMGLDLALLTEAKLTDGIHTRYSSGYHVVATEAASHRQGGVALVYKDSPYWQVESVERHGPNIISAELVTGLRRFTLVGVYFPPDDTTTPARAEGVLNSFRQRRNLLVLGDLNANLLSPAGDRDSEIALTMASHGLLDMSRHFRSSRMGGTTWFQQREGNYVGSRPDYILARDRRLFTRVVTRNPRHFTTNHLRGGCCRYC